MSAHSRLLAFLTLLGLSLFDLALAQVGGLDRVNTWTDSLQTLLCWISLIVGTGAVAWAFYRFFYRRAEIREVLYILGGGLLIGGAAEIARWLVGADW